MNVLVAEDEPLAAERIQDLVAGYGKHYRVVEVLDSVSEVVDYFRSGKTADILLLDIELADGKCFDIFEKVKIDIPVIFTTAYDKYAIQAFRLNSIDYLLKPVQAETLRDAFEKFERLKSSRIFGEVDLDLIRKMFSARQSPFKERFLIKAGNKLHFKSVEDVAYFFAEGKLVFLVTKKENRKYSIDLSLEELERTLDASRYFRISRKFIVSITSILEVKGLISTKLEIKLNQPCDHFLSVSRERSQDFKKWLDQ